MDFSTILNPIGSAVNTWATVKGVNENKRVNDLNYKLQLDNLAYQKDLQKIMFSREDNAVQRANFPLSTSYPSERHRKQ